MSFLNSFLGATEKTETQPCAGGQDDSDSRSWRTTQLLKRSGLFLVWWSEKNSIVGSHKETSGEPQQEPIPQGNSDEIIAISLSM